MDNKILRDLSYGVYVIGSLDGKRNVGCIANSVMQITSNPATVAISINRDNYTNECIKKCNRFSISVLNEKSDKSIITLFGFSSSGEIDKYKDINYEKVDKLPIIKDSNGYMICDVINTLETETHTIFIGKITSMNKINDEMPMTYKYYHDVLKGVSSKKAPTYIDIEKEIKSNSWRCTLCGYVYDKGELPLDFTCPLCGASRELFEKVE